MKYNRNYWQNNSFAILKKLKEQNKEKKKQKPFPVRLKVSWFRYGVMKDGDKFYFGTIELKKNPIFRNKDFPNGVKVRNEGQNHNIYFKI